MTWPPVAAMLAEAAKFVKRDPIFVLYQDAL